VGKKFSRLKRIGWSGRQQSRAYKGLRSIAGGRRAPAMSSAINSAQFKIEKPAKPRSSPAWFSVFSSPLISVVSTPASPDITGRAHAGRRTAELLTAYASTATKKTSRDRSCLLLWNYCPSAWAPNRACNRTVLHGSPGERIPRSKSWHTHFLSPWINRF
jgi:hypothetical protein